MQAFKNGSWYRHVDDIGVVYWWLDKSKVKKCSRAPLKCSEIKAYSGFVVQTLHRHVDQRLALDYESATTLYHRNVVAVIIVVSSNIVTGVAAPNYYRFLPFGLF